MNQEDLIKKVAENLDGGGNAKEVVRTFFSSIRNSLSNGESVAIKGFGKFKLVTRKARKGINPKTGEPIDIPEKRVARFVPATALKDEIN